MQRLGRKEKKEDRKNTGLYSFSFVLIGFLTLWILIFSITWREGLGGESASLLIWRLGFWD